MVDVKSMSSSEGHEIFLPKPTVNGGTPKPVRMFLSHISEETRLADLIEECIGRDFIGLVTLFMSSDRTSVLAGTNWLGEITAALREETLHVVLASPESIDRRWITFESGAAHVRGLHIIPVCHSGLTWDQLPYPLSAFEGINLSADGGFERLYQAVASQLGSDVPAVDFDAYRRHVAMLDDEAMSKKQLMDDAQVLTSGVETVRNPKALCISSQQFIRLGYENQLNKVLEAFPSSVDHERVLDSRATDDALRNNKIDIAHIAAFVCPRVGTLYFSDVDLRSGNPQPGVEIDSISPERLCELMNVSQTRLAVITSSDSLELAWWLTKTCHVVVARDIVTPNMMATWVDSFYHALAKSTLSEALAIALRASGAPMRLFPRQPNSLEVRVEQSVAASWSGIEEGLSS